MRSPMTFPMLRNVLALLIFVLLTAGFALKNPYYLPATLTLDATLKAGSQVALSWDSGSGFNPRERYTFTAPRPEGHTFPLPQIRLSALKLEVEDPANTIRSVTVTSSKGTVQVLAPDQGKHVYLMAPLNLGNAAFHGFLFAVQVALAALLTGLFLLAWNYVLSRRKLGIAGILSDAFINEQRYVFWGMAGGAFIAFGLWLLGQWPAVMTVDSYHFTWREIKTLQLTNVTPWVYNAYVLALTQLWDSPAAVSLFQVAATSLLGAGILYYCYQRGAARWIILACYLLFITSIPVGLYNLVIWKDIPFCLAMLAWGIFIFHLYSEKRYAGRVVSYSLPVIVLLAGFLLFLCTVRHNGIIFLVGVPAVLIAFRLLPRKNLLQFVLATAVGFIGLSALTTRLAVGDQAELGRVFSRTYRVGPLASIYSAKQFYSPTMDHDMALISKWMPPAELREKYTPVMQAELLAHMVNRWIALSPTDQAHLDRLYFMRSAQNLHLVAADRVATLAGTLGLSSNGFILLNELRHSMDKSFWRPIESYRLTLDPPSPFLNELTTKALDKTTTYTGPVPLPFLVFNSVPALLLLGGIFLAYKYVPGSALYAGFFLYNLPFMVIALATSEWRYLYFFPLASFFLLALASAERSMRKAPGEAVEVAMEAKPVLA